MERRLAAILACDVVGYSRLMGEDETATLNAVRALRTELIEPKVGQYHGRIVKNMGDGALMEFPSAVEAVAFATEMQTAIAGRNDDVPEDRRIVYRIGINVGDIVIEDDDIFGDGVNIAARLEALAEPGSVYAAQNVVDQVTGKLDLTWKLIGEREVKNIPRPVTVYNVVLDEKAAALTTPVVRETPPWHPKLLPVATLAALLIIAAVGLFWWKPWTGATQTTASNQSVAVSTTKPTVAVLPFNNMSNDESQEYFSDGMTEDLITDLSKVSGLLVIARNSTFAYKGKQHNIRDIGRELNARYIVEGSVRKAGGRVRINAQLIDARTGNHMWADRYDRNFDDVFALQDEVLEKIVKALRVTLTPSEQRRLAKHDTENPLAYDLYLQGLRQESFFNSEGNRESRRLFEQAIALDPNFASAHARLATAYSLAQENGWLPDRNAAARKALELAEKAVKLNSELPIAHWTLGRILTRPLNRDLERALKELQRAVELNPNYAHGHGFLAEVLTYTGRAEEALLVIETAIRMNPGYPFWYAHSKGQSLFVLGRYEEAIPHFKAAIERNPTVVWPHQLLLAAYGHLGKFDDAEWEISELEALGQPPTIKSILAVNPILYPAYRDRYLSGLRKAGVPEQ